MPPLSISRVHQNFEILSAFSVTIRQKAFDTVGAPAFGHSAQFGTRRDAFACNNNFHSIQFIQFVDILQFGFDWT